MTVILELKSLLEEVDGWFQDIELDVPIGQIETQDDKAKLADISRTTSGWFRNLTNVLTTEGIEDEPESTQRSDAESDVKVTIPSEQEEHDKPMVLTRSRQRSTKNIKRPPVKRKTVIKNSSLDDMARSLELLLDSSESKGNITTSNQESSLSEELFIFNVYWDRDEALNDPSIGSFITLGPDCDERESMIPFDDEEEFFNVIDRSVNNFCTTTTSKDRFGISSINLNHDLNVETSMPLDHDYLRAPKSQKSTTNHDWPRRSSRRVKSHDRPLYLYRSTSYASSVLNTEALRKFARFSDQFRILSYKHDRLLAIGDK